METNRIDSFFKETLGSAVSTPSEQSWGKLEAMMGKKKKAGLWLYYWSGAAVVALLIMSYFTYKFYSGSEANQLAQEEVIGVAPVTPKKDLNDAPVVAQIAEQENDVQEEIPARTEQHVPTKDEYKNDAVSNAVATQLVAETTMRPEENAESDIPEDIGAVVIPELNFSEDGAVAEEGYDTNTNVDGLEADEIVKANKKTRKRMPITIIYKRGNNKNTLIAENQTVESDTTRAKGQLFKSIISTTRDIAPADLWADLRAAKSNFFNSGFDLKDSKIKNSK